jgi:hypothetical protein
MHYSSTTVLHSKPSQLSDNREGMRVNFIELILTELFALIAVGFPSRIVGLQ